MTIMCHLPTGVGRVLLFLHVRHVVIFVVVMTEVISMRIADYRRVAYSHLRRIANVDCCRIGGIEGEAQREEKGKKQAHGVGNSISNTGIIMAPKTDRIFGRRSTRCDEAVRLAPLIKNPGN